MSLYFLMPVRLENRKQSTFQSKENFHLKDLEDTNIIEHKLDISNFFVMEHQKGSKMN